MRIIFLMCLVHADVTDKLSRYHKANLEVIVVRDSRSIFSPHNSWLRVPSSPTSQSEAESSRNYSTSRRGYDLSRGQGRSFLVLEHEDRVGVVAAGVTVAGGTLTVLVVCVGGVRS